MPDDALTAPAKALLQDRQDDYHRERPDYQCKPTGPQPLAGWRRIVQTPSLIIILNDNLTYRMIYMDGRTLEPDPERTWMGYSVGRWDGDTLVVDSFGFNDRTWLDGRGHPHTEALRTTERYQRRNYGSTHVELTVTDPAAFEKSWTTTYDLQVRPDTEMLEAVCESDQTHWVGRVSDVDIDAVTVSEETMRKYIGVYSGLWGQQPRTVRVQLRSATLYVNGLAGDEVRLIPQSESLFMGTNGLWYQFEPNGTASASVIERHVSGDWRYKRLPGN
jgi:hypothetical protein